MPPNTPFQNDSDSLPPICISKDTARFSYTYWGGPRTSVRIACVVSESVSLNHSNVRWFVFGDDDTMFFPENLVKTLSKYDHELWHYIGTNLETLMQNKFFSFDMAFGGAGFAINYPRLGFWLRVFDSCLERYPHIYGSDGRVHACIAELGIGKIHEPGFHQMDIRGNIFGLLAAHPKTPLVSLHNLDQTDPIFPNMTTTRALEHLLHAAKVNPHRLLQQTVCYDRWFSWTISVSWGYAVQVFGNHLFLSDVLRAQQTFKPWRRGNPLSKSSVTTCSYRMFFAHNKHSNRGEGEIPWPRLSILTRGIITWTRVEGLVFSSLKQRYFALNGLLFSSLLLHHSKAEDMALKYCNNFTNFTPGRAYAKSFNLTISSLSSKASLTGFFFTVVRQDPDVVYGLVQCMNGISSQDCQTCAQTSAQNILQLCPNQKEASIYYDSCLMEYYERNFYLVMNSGTIGSLYNSKSVTNPVVLDSELRSLVRSLPG
ncbi:glycosyltransferase [Actinidia rufa]|uniref:Glycosyltransferase n=1 Tax=Actinidia rufa TaxID=165716 RepID=A0A7J0DD83_9ERIC|nr:glycosyltransferase [Actinidia rufa]